MELLQNRLTIIAAALIAAAGAGTAHAQADAPSVDLKFLGADFSYNGLLRLETAISTSGKVSPANMFGLQSNGVPINRNAGNPATGYRTTLGGSNGLTDLLGQLGVVNLPGPDLTNPRGVSNNLGVSDTITRYSPEKDQLFNYHIVRFEASPTLSWGAWSFQSRIRALYDPGKLGYEEFDYGDYDDINGGFETGRGDAGRQYSGTPDHFGYEVDGKKNPIFFERSGKDYMVDLPAFFLQWTNGETTVRVGNQTIAWGQLLFFRLFDVANGLDLRRHLFIDRAIEEFADERESAPGIRVTVQATDTVVVDAFAQQFIPSIVPNSNTSYNIVDSRFILHDRYHESGDDEKINYGFRVKGEFGNFNLQMMAASRLNQLGTIRWDKSNINKALPNSNALGFAFNQYCQAVLGSPVGQGCGPQLAQTPFEVAPLGLLSAEEWFDRASYTKLDGVTALNAVVTDFAPITTQLLTSTVDNVNAANNELDAFFIASEGLHGHVKRDYFREEVYGLGGGYVTEGEPGSIFDQMLINMEVTYTKDRSFTPINLGVKPDVRDEYQVGLVVEKYQRFSQSFPATYMVFQYLWQKESSLEGLLLDGYGSENFTDQGIKLTKSVPTSTDPKITPGIKGGANYIVLAALQPTDAYIYEFSFAALIDVQGGVLIQPAVQWKPQGNVTVNLFYNFIDASVWGGNPNKTVLSFIDFADEVGIRLGYQF